MLTHRLPSNPDYLYFHIQRFETPTYQILPSFHKAVFESLWQVQDAYQEKRKKNLETESRP